MADVVLGAVIGAAAEELFSVIRNPGLFKKTNKVQELEKLSTTIRDVLQDHEEVNCGSSQLIRWLQSLLQDHEEVNCGSIQSIRWLQSLSILYEEIREEMEYRKKDTQKPSIIRWIKQAVKPDSTLEKDLKEFTRRYQELCRSKEILCGPLERDEERTRVIVGSVSSEPILFGRDSEFRKIIDFLEMPSGVQNGCDFIAIVGMGGIGKTTLAQFIYNYDKVASFTERAWCYVRGLRIGQIYRSMFEQLIGECHFQDSSAILERLLKELKGKKCLIVLDDFSNENVAELDALRSSLMAVKPGSKFIMTTRNRAVGKRFTKGEERIIDLGLMSNKDCWSMFCSGTSLELNSTSNLATIGKVICGKCEGLPLTVAKAKDMLFGIDNEAGWRTLLSKITSDVNSVIRVSCEKLPRQLRTCFSFYTIFPQDRIFSREIMVELWIKTEIILDEYQSKVAVQLFSDLLLRTLITYIGK